MSAEAKTWRVGIVGVSPSGLFLIERLSLESAVCLAGAYDHNPERTELAVSSGCPVWDHLDSALISTDTDVLFFVDHYTEEEVLQALRRGKHVVLDRPWQLSSDALLRLDKSARKSHLQATTDCHHRWSSSFVAPFTAIDQLGTLHSVRYTSCEQSVPTDQSFRGVLREFGYGLLDQLIQFVNSRPKQVFARQFFDRERQVDHGLLLTIDFDHECTAQIDLQSRSRLSHRTGWMLEGSKASYRNSRIYATTADGEIVDEPVPSPAMAADPFFQELVSAWQGQTSKLPSLEDAAKIVRLVEIIEQSSTLNQSIRCEW